MSIALPAEPFEWHEQTELLKQAAKAGNVDFLKECVSHNAPNEYYLSQLEVGNDAGNLLHIASCENRIQFVKQVIELLNPQVIHQLMLQQSRTASANPLHLAAFKGNVEVVKLIIEFYSSRPSSSSSSSSSLKPWLQVNIKNQTPCHCAVLHFKEECALEILKMDMKQLSQVVDNTGVGLLYAALRIGLNDIALKILESPTSFNCSGFQSWSPLHILTRQSSDRRDICRLLLERAPHLVEHTTDDRGNILHTWALFGKVWPFEFIIHNCNDIIPDIRRVVVNLMSSTERNHDANPFHFLAAFAPNEEDAVAIIKILIKTYRQEAAQPGHLQPPWLAENRYEFTPLDCCLERKYQNLAMHILLEEKDALMEDQGRILAYAVRSGCPEVAEQILNSVDTDKWTELKDHNTHMNALHLAPYCTEEFLELLVNGNPKLLEGITKAGCTILHIWAEIGYVWPFQYILQRYGVNHPEWNGKLLLLLRKQDGFGNTIFHYAVRNKQETANNIVLLLVNAFKELYSSWKILKPYMLPWCQQNNSGDGALHEAIRSHRQELALKILSLFEPFECDDNHELLDNYWPKCKTLFLAMENNCYQVAKNIVANLRKQDRTPYLKDSSNGQSILHLAPSCTDEEFGKWLVSQAPEFILEADNSGKTPLDNASDAGADWIIRAMLQTNPTSIFNKAPRAWISACQNGHISAIRAFIDCYPGRFKDHCVKHKDSPLHHIKLPNITSYEDFLTIPQMKNLVNIQDSNGATPLHSAIRKKNIHLTEVLLNIEDVLLDIKDNDKQTARYLLGIKCNEDQDWKNMCEENGFDLSMRLTYLQRKTNLLDARNTLSVVAALLATISFTAGFTLPGGFNQDTGEAILAKKAAFLAFLIFDTIALCSSMLVLTCLIWSMVYDSNKSLLLIDRSMKLLMVSLYSTMIAFMCGVFVVISQKSMWAAILVIVICSLLGISARRSLLYKVVDKLMPSPNTDYKDRFSLCLAEMGKVCPCQGDSNCWKCN